MTRNGSSSIAPIDDGKSRRGAHDSSVSVSTSQLASCSAPRAISISSLIVLCSFSTESVSGMVPSLLCLAGTPAVDPGPGKQWIAVGAAGQRCASPGRGAAIVKSAKAIDAGRRAGATEHAEQVWLRHGLVLAFALNRPNQL